MYNRTSPFLDEPDTPLDIRVPPGAVKSWSFKRYYTPNQTLACFVLYLKIINTFLKKKIYMHPISKLSKELETGIKI